MATGNFVSYTRVSTRLQGASGLGLSAQREAEAISQYLNGGDWKLLKEFEEVESGKNNERPELLKALEHCQLTGATLLVAKLDRLSRDIHFITSLEKAGIEFVVCDFPAANKFTIHIFAALAQYERELISQRTKAALARSTKAKGVMGKENLMLAADAGREKGRQAKVQKADEFAGKVKPMLKEYREKGMSFDAIATALNKEHILTARGYKKVNGEQVRIAWTAAGVRNALLR